MAALSSFTLQTEETPLEFSFRQFNYITTCKSCVAKHTNQLHYIMLFQADRLQLPFKAPALT
jgi:hypothetical protein